MTLDELYLDINSANFDNIVCQKDIKTDEDIKYWNDKGYYINTTLDKFEEKFDIDAGNIWYTTSMSMFCFYFNKETLAVAPFHMEFYMTDAFKPEKIKEGIEDIEKKVSEGNYDWCIMNLPDNMKMEYLKMIVEKKENIPNLYELFFDTYTSSDYGFNDIDRRMFDKIVDAMPEEEDERINVELNKYPDVITVYRGGNSASTPYQKAYSWTTDINVANFFASRRGKDTGYIAVGHVKRRNVITIINDRNESEIIVRPEDVKDIDVIPVYGLDFLENMIPQITSMYHEYRDLLDRVWFYNEDGEHGKLHSARVMLLSLILGRRLNLSNADMKKLCIASVYHDIGRTHDGVCTEHGIASAKEYVNDVKVVDPYVEFLIKYHCKPDEEGRMEISRNKKLNRMKAEILFNIFKDADALDRVRFGSIKNDLDLEQLRTPFAKQMTLIARLCVQQIKL